MNILLVCPVGVQPRPMLRTAGRGVATRSGKSRPDQIGSAKQIKVDLLQARPGQFRTQATGGPLAMALKVMDETTTNTR